MLLQSVFFSLYSQENLSIILFSESGVSHTIISLFGIEKINLFGHTLSAIPTTFFQTLDPAWNVIIGVLLAFLWFGKKSNCTALNAFYKFFLGVIAITIAFKLLSTAIVLANPKNISPWWMIITYGLFVMGELFIVPIGLSLVSSLSPKKISSVFMAIWYLSFGFSLWFAGVLAEKFRPIQSSNHTDYYLHLFGDFSLLGLILVFCLLATIFFLSRINFKEVSL